MTELLPCPFCGDPEPVVINQEPDVPVGKVMVGCRGCGSQTRLFENTEHAIKRWNARAPLSPTSHTDEADG